jgi:neurofibromin 1
LGDADVKEGTQRTLLLVSKMVNNLMNDVAFGDKEPFMVQLNGFLSQQNKEAVQRFIQRLTVRAHDSFFFFFCFCFYFFSCHLR